MAWGDCGTDEKGRPIGYNFSATCDLGGCGRVIDRGISYACGQMHGDEGIAGEPGCPLYFCDEHLHAHDCPALEAAASAWVEAHAPPFVLRWLTDRVDELIAALNAEAEARSLRPYSATKVERDRVLAFLASESKRLNLIERCSSSTRRIVRHITGAIERGEHAK